MWVSEERRGGHTREAISDKLAVTHLQNWRGTKIPALKNIPFSSSVDHDKQ